MERVEWLMRENALIDVDRWLIRRCAAVDEASVKLQWKEQL